MDENGGGIVALRVAAEIIPGVRGVEEHVVPAPNHILTTSSIAFRIPRRTPRHHCREQVRAINSAAVPSTLRPGSLGPNAHRTAAIGKSRIEFGLAVAGCCCPPVRSSTRSTKSTQTATSCQLIVSGI
jgi:hypothetical protein